MKLAEHVVCELQQPGEAEVDPARARALPPEDELRVTGEQALHADAVAAQIHQGAAVELRKQADVGFVREREGEM